MKTLTLTIDGKICAGAAGQTILEVATASGIEIPTLCHMKELSPWGGCRMCIVEVGGIAKPVPSCATPAADGSVVVTKNERLDRLRKLTLELLFSERNHICPICPMNKGDCELQMSGYKFGIDGIRFPYLYPALPVDLTGKYLGLDHNRCILCARCIRTCDEIEGAHTLDLGNRGVKSQVIVDLNSTFGASTTCTHCGACVSACPTGALFDKNAAFHGALKRCAQVRTTCAECPVGCGLVVYTMDDRIVDVFGDGDSPVNRGHLCVRGRYETWAVKRERLTEPMVRRNGALAPVAWDEALAAIRAATRGLKSGEKGLLVSGRLTNEAAETLAKIRPSVSSVGMYVAENEAAMCGDPGAARDVFPLLQEADAFVLLGADPARLQGVVAARIRVAVRKRGAKLVMLNVRSSDLDAYADISSRMVGLERAFWKRVADVLKGRRKPVLIYGPNAMTSLGVAAMEKLLKTFDADCGPSVIGLPATTNALALSAAGVEAVDDLSRWFASAPLRAVHVCAADEPAGGARILREREVAGCLKAMEFVVLQTAYFSRLVELADVVLPALAWSERSGTITNFEGRKLPLRPALTPRGQARDDADILESIYA
ncbi:MAG: molybdopterin-dependent oxidoreductase [Verrucomicrobiae bacterium]|nr:molybdopterin-dependent oxidoreductase [Verrucomicrobiae bacterium]